MTLLDEYSALLKSLGIHPEVVTYQDRKGRQTKELHLYCDGARLDDVLAWKSKRQQPFSVRVFESDPPPF